jgi:hypothetical protein
MGKNELPLRGKVFVYAPARSETDGFRLSRCYRDKRISFISVPSVSLW